ncbi:hypothetical protein NC651_017265 [Populus alba x Populus x berolinensis]|nr:hypothetical protein NC651_017265 [Populus alba x Populus x berolinensis]
MVCDAQIAIMISSTGPKEKVYTFSHTSVDVVFNMFLDNFTTTSEAVTYETGIKLTNNSL